MNPLIKPIAINRSDWPTGALPLFAALLALAASVLQLRAQETPKDICQLLGGRSDRNFAGRPGNLYAVVGAKARLIYMAVDLSTKSSLFQGKVVEWRPDYVQLEPDALGGVDGQPVEGVVAEKFCWIGPADSVLTEHVFKNPATTEKAVRLSFDLQGVEEVKLADGILNCKISAGFPRSVVPQLFGALCATHPVTMSDGKMWMDVSVPGGKSVNCVVVLAVGADVGRTAHAARPSADPRGESTDYWNHMLTAEIPTFACSNPYLEKLNYFRW